MTRHWRMRSIAAVAAAVAAAGLLAACGSGSGGKTSSPGAGRGERQREVDRRAGPRAAGEAGRRGRALRAYRHKVALVFQDPFASLNPIHTVRHHLARPLSLRPGAPRGPSLEEQIRALLRSVNLTPPEEVAGKHPPCVARLLAAAAPEPGASRSRLAAACQARRANQSARQPPRTDRAAEQREAVAGAGCRFRGRCPHAMEICATRPPDATVSPAHRALCWLHDPAGAGAAGELASR